MTKAIASVSAGGRELVLSVTSSPPMPSAPSNITQHQCRCFRSQEDLIKNSSGQEVNIGSPGCVPSYCYLCSPSLPSMKILRRASCDRGALSLKRSITEEVSSTNKGAPIPPPPVPPVPPVHVELPTKLERSLSASTLSFISGAPAGSALVC